MQAFANPIVNAGALTRCISWLSDERFYSISCIHAVAGLFVIHAWLK
jgi:hypothetical protein